MTRHVSQLRAARRLSEWPSCISKSKSRGVMALGHRYEALVARQLPSAERGVWWQYLDANGPGLCQTDLILRGSRYVAILECKHTWCEEGLEQLRCLYAPVLRCATGLEPLSILVCKNLVRWAPAPHQSLVDAIAEAKGGQIVTLHWRGLGPLMPKSARAPASASASHTRAA